MTRSGTVYLVGAGPGNPGMITWRGIECLRQADVVLYDYLVNPEILRHVSERAELICLGRHGRSNRWSQQKVNQSLVDAARAGKQVVRLKSGDPIVFGRAAEELDELIAAQIPFEIVPGITAALAAGGYAGIPVTHRGLASAVALITGQEDADKQGDSLDFASLASFPGTLVIYMGVTSAKVWTQGLLRAGKPAETPVALVRRCSWPDQQVRHCRLDEVVEHVTPYHKFPPPVIAIVGEVSCLEQSLGWFQHRPLFGRRVLVSRSPSQAAEMRDKLLALGADVLSQPAITIEDPVTWAEVDDCLARLSEFDWLVFASSNGVERFLTRLEHVGHDLRALGGVQLAVLGPGTAAALQRFRLHADCMPNADFRAESLVDALRAKAPGQRFLIVRADRGRDVLADGLKGAGGQVEEVAAYRSVDVLEPSGEVTAAIEAGRVDWVTVTSSAIATSLVRLLGERLRKTRLVSISPLTSSTLTELGHPPQVEATESTIDGIVNAILNDLSAVGR